MANQDHALLIAQMTDIHIGFDPDAKPEELNRIRFRETLDRLVSAPNKPDFLVLSGDLTDHGDLESFEKTAALLEVIECPILAMVGNHDTREGLLHAFPDTPTHDGFIQYATEKNGLRILCLDTMEPGRHGGAFCDVRAAWLSDHLAAHPDTPTMIFMHHPPIVSGHLCPRSRPPSDLALVADSMVVFSSSVNVFRTEGLLRVPACRRNCRTIQAD